MTNKKRNNNRRNIKEENIEPSNNTNNDKPIFTILLLAIIAILTIVVFIQFNQIKEIEKLVKSNLEQELKEKEELEEAEKKIPEVIENNNPDLAEKSIFEYHKSDLEEMIKEEFITDNIEDIYTKLSNYSVWANAGFSERDASAIANRIGHNKNKTNGILQGIIVNDKGLKIVVIPTGNKVIINYGSFK